MIQHKTLVCHLLYENHKTICNLGLSPRGRRRERVNTAVWFCSNPWMLYSFAIHFFFSTILSLHTQLVVYEQDANHNKPTSNFNPMYTHYIYYYQGEYRMYIYHLTNVLVEIYTNNIFQIQCYDLSLTKGYTDCCGFEICTYAIEYVCSFFCVCLCY